MSAKPTPHRKGSEEYRDQHWIPKSYTKEWVDPNGPKNGGKRVHLYDRDGKYIRWTYPPGVFSEDNLYTIKNPDGSRDTRTEKSLSMIETGFSIVRKKLLKRRRLEPRDKAIIATFVAAMRNRSPAMFQHFNDFWKHLVETGENLKKDMETAPAERRARMARISKLHGNSENESMSLDDVKEIAESPFGRTLPSHIRVETPILAKMRMTVLHTDDELGFITSDSPVTWWVPDPKGLRTKRRFGLGHPDIEVTMPLSPSACLLLTRRMLPEHIDLSSEQVDAINMRTLSTCRAIFIANSPDLIVDWFEEDDIKDDQEAI